MDNSLLEEIEKIEKRLNTIAEQENILYEIQEVEMCNLAINGKYCKIKINIYKQLR